MKLHAERQGHGPDLVLLHGWGVNSGVWEAVLPSLTLHFCVTRVDLPGHGASRALSMPAELDALADQVLTVAPAAAVWLGWSLGGLVCLRIALRAPARVRALLLSNTTPRFTRAPDWPHAMPAAQLAAFATELSQDFAGTLHRFLALQVLGDEHARTTLRVLHACVSARGEPDAASLAAGLALLHDSDVRNDLPRVIAPTLVLSGAYDRLTPPQAGVELARMMPDASCISLPRAGHAPFISHPAGFVRALHAFLDSRFPAEVLRRVE